MDSNNNHLEINQINNWISIQIKLNQCNNSSSNYRISNNTNSNTSSLTIRIKWIQLYNQSKIMINNWTRRIESKQRMSSKTWSGCRKRLMLFRVQTMSENGNSTLKSSNNWKEWRTIYLKTELLIHPWTTETWSWTIHQALKRVGDNQDRRGCSEYLEAFMIYILYKNFQ